MAPFFNFDALLSTFFMHFVNNNGVVFLTSTANFDPLFSKFLI